MWLPVFLWVCGMEAGAENEIGRDESKEVEEPEGGSLKDIDGNHNPDGTESKSMIISEGASTPGSKRRLVTEVIGNDDVDVSRPQDMDEGEVRRVVGPKEVYLFCSVYYFDFILACFNHFFDLLALFSEFFYLLETECNMGDGDKYKIRT